MLKYSVGTDISSTSFDTKVCVINEQQKVLVKSSKSKIPNTKEGFKILAIWVKKNHEDKAVPLVVCMEAKGFITKTVRCIYTVQAISYRLFYPTKPRSICSRWVSNQRMTK